ARPRDTGRTATSVRWPGRPVRATGLPPSRSGPEAVDDVEVEPATVGANRVVAARPFVGHARRPVLPAERPDRRCRVRPTRLTSGPRQSLVYRWPGLRG